jgi:hypothetical protein
MSKENRVAKGLVMLVAACSLDLNAQEIPAPVLDYSEADMWHDALPGAGDDIEENMWELEPVHFSSNFDNLV